MEDKLFREIFLRTVNEELIKEKDPEKIEYLQGLLAECEKDIMLSSGGAVQ